MYINHMRYKNNNICGRKGTVSAPSIPSRFNIGCAFHQTSAGEGREEENNCGGTKLLMYYTFFCYTNTTNTNTTTRMRCSTSGSPCSINQVALTAITRVNWIQVLLRVLETFHGNTSSSNTSLSTNTCIVTTDNYYCCY